MIAFQGIFEDLKEEIVLSLSYVLEEMLKCQLINAGGSLKDSW